MTQATCSMRYLIDLLGPEVAAAYARPLTAREIADVDAALAAHGGDPVGALNMHHLPEDIKAEIRRVMR